MSPWNPGGYLKFEDERTRPSVDLCARILASPRSVLDVGCGPGNSTRVLRDRWPGAEIIGMDSSPEMIERAKASHPAGAWVLADAATYDPGRLFDVVFSNAALQWLPNQEEVLPRLLGLVAPGGCLAVQVPAGGRTGFRAAVRTVAELPRWRPVLDGAGDALSFHEPAFFYDLLAPLEARVDLWETTYFHALASHQAVIDWFEQTGMRPYLERLGEADRAAFKAEVLDLCRGSYPLAADGKVLMPFQRVLFVAWKGDPRA
jgi:trans-aconitate 2-methyltransferase